MTATVVRRGVRPLALVIGVLGAFVGGVLVASGVAAVANWAFDESRSGLSISDIALDSSLGFPDGADASPAQCGDRRGCVEGLSGEGVSIYRFDSADHARQYVVGALGGTDASSVDVYRSDRLVIEFDPGFDATDRAHLMQLVEGTWTGSDD